MSAGLLPRLARDDQNFLPLPVVRPKQAVLTGDTGFISSLDEAYRKAGLAKNRSDIAAAVKGGLNSSLPLLIALQKNHISKIVTETSGRRTPTLVLPIDQAEELFVNVSTDESNAFLKLVAGLSQEEFPALIVLFTIRSDNYERLQTARQLDTLRQVTLSLPPMPQGAYTDIIKGPARRLDGSGRNLKTRRSRSIPQAWSAGGARAGP